MSSSKKPVVLITSATSRNGSEVAKQLLAQGKHAVRLAARDASRLGDLVAQGAEAVAVDPASAESVSQACAGADIVYLILPTLVGEAENVMFRSFLQSCSGSARHIVYLSGVDAQAPGESGFQPIHSHYEHEQALRSSGVAFTSLRPGWFHENQVAYHSQSVRSSGEFRTSAGDGLWTSVAVRDIAAAAVAVISDPAPHAGKVYTLTTEAVSDPMVAEKISKVTGQSVRHVNMTPEEHTDVILRSLAGRSSAKEPEEFARGIVTLDWEKRMSLFSEVHPDLELLIGRKGVSLDAFLAEHADAFKQQVTPHQSD